MSALPTSRPDRRDNGDGPAHSKDAVGDVRGHLLRLSLIPAVVIAVLGIAGTTLLLADRSTDTRYVVLALVVTGCAVAVVVAVAWTNTTARVLQRQLDAAAFTEDWIQSLRWSAARGQEEIARLVEQVRKGERPVPYAKDAPSADGGFPFELLACELHQAQQAAESAIVQVTDPTFAGAGDQRVEVFVNIGRRLQSLIHRAIQKLDELEYEVEDPDLLKGLFVVDHLATGVRRHAESLAVLGGAPPRRQWTSPVSMYAVLRSAIAEVEQYSRVKVVPAVEGTVRGHAVADIIHLIAELVENATAYSRPDTHVTVRALPVTAGLAIEIDDRGLGMPIADQQKMNALLANPGQINIGELLKDGRIGLCVVSELARRHNIAVRLQTNIYGGIQAVVVLPHNVLGTELDDTGPTQVSDSAHRRALPAEAGHARGGSSAFAPPADMPSPVPAYREGRHAGSDSSEPYGVNGHRWAGQLETTPGESGPVWPDWPVAEDDDPTPTQETPSLTSFVNPGDDHTAVGDPRPPLPRRRPHALPLPDAPADLRVPAADYDHGLMAAFQRGIQRGAQEDGDPLGGTAHTS